MLMLGACIDSNSEPSPTPSIPEDLAALVCSIRTLQLPRTFRPSPIPSTHTQVSATLMTEKKAHEVTRMASLVSSIAKERGVQYVVDVGAGQVCFSTMSTRGLINRAA